jgi:outer membrane lipoprotein LolB
MVMFFLAPPCRITGKAWLRFCSTALALGFLTACTTPKPISVVPGRTLAKIQHFEIRGKLGFREGKKGGNARLAFQQNKANYLLCLYGPFGSGSIRIVGQPGAVSLTDANGKIHRAATAEQLVAEVLGWSIPVSGLSYWIRGLPAPGTPPTYKQYNTAGHLIELKQQGWKIMYSDYSTTGNFHTPYLINLSNGSLQIKLILQNWFFPDQEKVHYKF